MATIQSPRSWMGQSFESFISRGGLPAVPGASQTFAPFETKAIIVDALDWFMVEQAPAPVGPLNAGDGNYWLAAHRSEVDVVAGWTRQPDTHYLWQQAAVQPPDPSGGVIFTQAVVAGGVITAASSLAATSPLRSQRVGSALYAQEVGVFGDNATENSLALQRAINLSDHVQLPAGTIEFDQTISLRAGMLLSGAGMGHVDFPNTGTILQYTGTGVGILIDGDTNSNTSNQTTVLEKFSIRSETGTVGLHILNASDIDLTNIRVGGTRIGSGLVASGWTTAGILVDATPGGISLIIHLTSCYLQANAGDGILCQGLGEINGVNIHSCRIQGNLGWGVNIGVQTRGTTIVGCDVEGNALGSIRGWAPIGWLVAGNYMEDGGAPFTYDFQGNVGGNSGGLTIVGNSFAGAGFNTGLRIGQTLPVEGVLVSGNMFSGYDTAVVFPVGISNAQLGPNQIIFTTNDYIGRPGFGVTITRAGDSSVQLVDHESQIQAAVGNTGVETPIFTSTLPAFTFDGASGLRYTASGVYNNNSGAVASVTFRLRYRTAQVMLITFSNLPTTPFPRSWILEAHLYGDTNFLTNLRIKAWLMMSDPNSATAVGQATQVQNTIGSIGVPAADVIGDLELSIQHNVANSLVTGQLWSSWIETLRA
ncbi:MAG: hypothetical protein ACR2P5_02330 [Gammaproteobacteria bacterium]